MDPPNYLRSIKIIWPKTLFGVHKIMDPQNLFGVHKAEINDNRPCSDLTNDCGFVAAVSPFLKLAKTFANTPLQIRTHDIIVHSLLRNHIPSRNRYQRNM